MDDEIQKNVQELHRAITVAGLNFEIWWVYKEKENRKQFIDTFNAYPLFFQTSLHAHFVAMIVSLYSLYETRNDTINLPQVLRFLRNHGTVPIQEINKIDSKLTQMKPLWTKVAVLRNSIFGHRSSTLDYEGIWKKAGVTPNQFKELIDESKKILNEITVLYNKSGHAFNLSVTQNFVGLLEELTKLNGKNL